MKVLLIAGGWSPEREISLRGAVAVREALESRGHDVTQFDLSEGFEKLLEMGRQNDVAFLNLHGAPGEDGIVQAMLERVGCPYQGGDPASSFLALHKSTAKALFRDAGIDTSDWIFLPKRPADDWEPNLPYPLFVKSDTGGSSIDLFRVTNREELHAALDKLFNQGLGVLIEPLIKGKEMTCGVLEREGKTVALPPVLIVPKREFFDYHDKYAGEAGASEICPAPMPADIIAEVQKRAVMAHEALGLSGYSRTDFIVGDDGRIYALEVNTLPGMTPTSLVPKEAAAEGIDFGELLEHLLFTAMANHKG